MPVTDRILYHNWKPRNNKNSSIMWLKGKYMYKKNRNYKRGNRLIFIVIKLVPDFFNLAHILWKKDFYNNHTHI